MPRLSRRINDRVFGCLGLLLLGCVPAASAATLDPEWPCIQVLVPEVALAVMWPEPVEEQDQIQWRQDDSLSGLAEKLGDLEAFTETEQTIIDDFAATQSAAVLQSSLNQLAVGVVAVANRVRSDYIRGIKRYTRQQISLAARIEEALNTLASSENLPASEKLELEESLQWLERIYDQREKAIPALCERPVELEEKLSSVLRHLSMHLP